MPPPRDHGLPAHDRHGHPSLPGSRAPLPTPRYEELPPPPALADHVQCCWSFEIPVAARPFRHAIIPDGTVSLVLAHRPAAALRLLTITAPCATARWITVSPGDSFRGIRLLPGASSALLGIAAGAFAIPSQPLADLHPVLAARLKTALAAAHTTPQVFAALARELAPGTPCTAAPDRMLQRAITRLMCTHGNARIGPLARTAGISERQLRRRFQAAVGLSPKQFSRALRVRAACIRIVLSPGASLAAIAQDAGYADQAHLSREFSAVFGSQARGLSALLRGYAHSRFQTPADAPDRRAPAA
jgi:AraC-like DNA-binding protein